MKKKRFSVEQIVAVLKQAEPLFQNGMNTQADQPCGYCAFAKNPTVTTAIWSTNCRFLTKTWVIESILSCKAEAVTDGPCVAGVVASLAGAGKQPREIEIMGRFQLEFSIDESKIII
jgi:hypothetical protein